MSKVLDPNDSRPVFLVHQPFQQRKRLPECIEYISSSFSESLRVGTIIRLPKISPRRQEEYVKNCSDYTDIIIIDPELYSHGDDMGTAKSAAKNYTYMSTEIPEDVNSDWIEYILNKQRQYGATVLLSPSTLLNTARPEKELSKQLGWAKEAQNLIEADETLMVNLTLSHIWLSDRKYRTLLLNEIMDMDSEHFYIRVLWPPLRPQYGQQQDPNILKGYKELSTYMGLENRILILPTTNLTGWFSTALGATGFSMGPSKDQQCFAEEIKIARTPGQPSPPRKNRFFEKSLLHVVELPTHDTLTRADGYIHCDCEYCSELDAKNPRRAGTWDHEASSLHQIFNTAQLTASLASKNPRARSSRLVRNALDFYNSLPQGIKPTGENKPNHLEIWLSLLE